MCVYVCVLVAKLCPALCNRWTVACQAPLFTGFSRQEYWSGLPFPSPGDLPDQGSNLGLLHCRRNLYHLSYHGSPCQSTCNFKIIKPKIVKHNLSHKWATVKPPQWLRLYTPKTGAQVWSLIRELYPHPATKNSHVSAKDPTCCNKDLVKSNK